MSPATRAKLDLTFAVAVFGTIGIFVRSIPLPSSVIALVRGAVGAAFLLSAGPHPPYAYRQGGPPPPMEAAGALRRHDELQLDHPV